MRSEAGGPSFRHLVTLLGTRKSMNCVQNVENDNTCVLVNILLCDRRRVKERLSKMDTGGKKVEFLIVDTSAFIRNVQLQEMGDHIITEEDVVHEIKNKRQLRRLVVLPYDLEIKSVFPENIHFVSEFAKKTGDYISLSATDIKVIALTYQLEKEKVGSEHLKSQPAIVKTVRSGRKSTRKDVAGFYLPKNTKKEDDTENNEESKIAEDKIVEIVKLIEENAKEENEKNELDGDQSEDESDYDTAESDLGSEDNENEDENENKDDYEDENENEAEEEEENLTTRFQKLKCDPSVIEIEGGDEDNVDRILPQIGSNEDSQDKNEYDDDDDDDDNDDDGDDEESEEEEEEGEEEEEEEDDNDGWITPKNINYVRKQMDADIVEEKPVTVACLTTDFAMQNVLKQIGLNIASLDGRVIKQMRTFILRCYACFKTTSVMTKVFCPNCGNKTLKKVAVSMDSKGNKKIHINFKKPLSARGKRFSLPTPQGGKHANNPILCEDQPVPDQRPTRLARTKNDPLKDDYIAGYSPFVMRDVNSKSAMLGIRSTGVKHWMKRNPNEPRRRVK